MPDRSRLRRWTALAVAAAVLGGLAAWGLRPAPRSPVSVVPPATPSAASAPSAGARPVAAAPSAASTAPGVARATSASAPEPGTVELCDGGRIARGDVQADDDELQRRLQPILDEVDRRVGAHADPRVRALAAFHIGDPEAEPETVRRARDALARDAVHGSDPQLYRLALQACSRAPRSAYGACQLVDARGWARRDAGNGAAWLAVAEAARQRGDEAELNEALFRIARATRFDARPQLFVELVRQAQPADTPRWARLQLDALAIGLGMAFTPTYAALMKPCERPALADANRRQLCEALADTLERRGTTMMDAGMAMALRQRLEGESARVMALRRQQDAVFGWMADSVEPAGLDCASAERAGRWFGEVIAHGELEAARRGLARSGRSEREWAAGYRARRAQVALQPPSAASR